MHPLYKKIRFLFRFSTALVQKYYLALGLGIALGTLSFFLVPRLLSLLPPIRPTQTIAVIGRHTQSDIPLQIQQHMSIGLTTLTPDGQPSPALAKSWTVSEDGQTYTFEINITYQWHDGTPLVSQDINYRFSDATVNFPNPHQLVINLTEPFSPLTTTALTRPVFKPVKPKWSRRSPDFQGLGAYRLAALSKNGQFIQTLTLAPQDTASKLPNLKYIFYASQDTAITAFKLGLVRTILHLPKESPLGNWPSVRQLPSIYTDRFVGLFFANREPFADTSGKNLRLALAYAIDKSTFSPRALGPISSSSWAYNSDLKSYDQDLQKAKAFLTKVSPLPDRLTLTTTSSYLPIAEHIKSDWEILGVPTDVVTSPDITADFSILLFAQSVPADPDQYNLWHSAGSSNITRLNSPRIDKLLEDGRHTTDLATRRTIYDNFQKFLVDDLPVIFLYQPTTYTLTRD